MPTQQDAVPQGQQDFSNPTQVAIAITELRGVFALLQQNTSSAINNLASTNQALQAEIRAMHHKFDAIPQIQQMQHTLSESIDRAFAAIATLADTTNNRIDSLDTSHKDTRERVLKWAGGAIVVAALAGIMVGVGMFYEDKLAAVEAEAKVVQGEQIVENSRRIREVELFIARSNRQSEDEDQ